MILGMRIAAPKWKPFIYSRLSMPLTLTRNNESYDVMLNNFNCYFRFFLKVAEPVYLLSTFFETYVLMRKAANHVPSRRRRFRYQANFYWMSDAMS